MTESEHGGSYRFFLYLPSSLFTGGTVTPSEQGRIERWEKQLRQTAESTGIEVLEVNLTLSGFHALVRSPRELAPGQRKQLERLGAVGFDSQFSVDTDYFYDIRKQAIPRSYVVRHCALLVACLVGVLLLYPFAPLHL